MQTNYVPAVIAAGISLVMHGFLLAILVLVPSPLPEETVGDAGLEPVVAQKNEEKKTDFFDDVGDPDKDLGGLDPNPNELKDDVAAPIKENEPTGMVNEAPTVLNDASIPPPPGLAPGVFQGPEAIAEAGSAMGAEVSTGMGGIISAGGMVGRSGGGKKVALSQGGGSEVSEAAVARGLRWLANTQNKDGSWSIEKLGGNTKNDVAGAALGVLPFLAAGITHRPNSEKVEESNEAGKKVRVDHSLVVQRALNFLMLKQNKRTGAYNENAYAHSLATIALCEACGLTGDAQLRASAQRGIAYVIEFQDPKGGGWRYTPKQEGDMSVTGWMFMALKSAQMAGIRVPSDRYKLVERFLDQCLNRTSGGYGYQDANASPAMTAAGMLCRLYLGTRPNNEALRKGAKILLTNPPSANGDLYYLYYATQAMHHMGSQDECWDLWNLGPTRNGKGGIRDYLIEKQVGGPRSTKAAPPNLAGSWNPEGDTHAVKEGGRLMQTSLALLTLEVYYRHLPLYMSDAGR
jgi:hypothetical protein